MKKVFNVIFIFLLTIILFASNKVYAEEKWIGECVYGYDGSMSTFLYFNRQTWDYTIMKNIYKIDFTQEDLLNYYDEHKECPVLYVHSQKSWYGNNTPTLDFNSDNSEYALDKLQETINSENDTLLTETEENTGPNPKIDSTLPDITTCTGLLGDPIEDEGSPAYYLVKAFEVIKYVALVLLIVLSVMDFTGAVAKQDKDALSKILKKVMMRFILCIIIFFLPYFVRLLLYYLYQRQIGLCGIGG